MINSLISDAYWHEFEKRLDGEIKGSDKVWFIAGPNSPLNEDEAAAALLSALLKRSFGQVKFYKSEDDADLHRCDETVKIFSFSSDVLKDKVLSYDIFEVKRFLLTQTLGKSLLKSRQLVPDIEKIPSERIQIVVRRFYKKVQLEPNLEIVFQECRKIYNEPLIVELRVLSF